MCHGPVFASLFLRDEIAGELLDEADVPAGGEDGQGEATPEATGGTPSFLNDAVEDDLQILTGGAEQ